MHHHVRVALRLTAVVGFAVSAVTGAQAAWSRWAVCFAGGFESAACMLLQDHRYDYELPAEPWVPITDAAQREGISYLALGFALLAIAVAMGGRWYLRAAAAVVAASWLATGVPTLQAGLSQRPLERAGDVWTAVGVLQLGGLVLPLLLAGLALLPELREHLPDLQPLLPRRREWLLAPPAATGLVWLAVTAAHPVPEMIVAASVHASHDTHPGTGLVRSVFVAAAAMVLLAAPWRRPAEPGRPEVTAPGRSTPEYGTSSR